MRKIKTTLLLILFAAVLSGCSPQDRATVRYRVTAMVSIDKKLVEGHSVMEASYALGKKTLLGRTKGRYAHGEAIVVEMGRGRRFYILPHKYAQQWPAFVFGVSDLLVKADSASQLQKLRSLKVGDNRRLPLAFEGPPWKLPQPPMLTFRDEADPLSVVEVTPENFSGVFGQNAKFLGLAITITDEPVTEGRLVRLLPFLLTRGVKFSHRPDGYRPRSIREEETLQLSWKLHPYMFFARDSFKGPY